MSVKANKSLDDGLVLYLPMNEGSGSTGFDRAKGNNNAIIPSDIWVVDAEKGVVPHFNNLDSKNLEIPASTDFDLEEQTISFWFKIDAIDGLQVDVLSRKFGSANWMFYRNNHWSNGQLGLNRYYMSTDALARSVLTRRIGWEINTWYHVCMVLHADGKSEDYVNGVLWSDNAVPVDFDYWITSTYKYFTTMQGYLKDIRVYDRALSETEVSALYRLGLNKSLSDGLVLDMPLNEGSGSTVFDKSKYSNNGAITGAAWVVDEEKGKCLSFDGDNDYVTVVDNDVLNFDADQDFTLSAWVKFNVIDGKWRSIINKCIPNNDGFSLMVHPTNSQLYFYRWDSDSTNSKAFVSNTSLITGIWYHVVLVREAGGTNRFYINGLEDAIDADVSYNYATNQPLLFGKYSLSPNHFLDGVVDDIRIYNRALSGDEVSALYRLTKKGVE